mmetsp:Transcript_26278/g.91398  ORF Transcript_26278/g.91398 Transcript_26278/m.91398 type:complete len:394 (+) Transcript_26278:518-1699(+)
MPRRAQLARHRRLHRAVAAGPGRRDHRAAHLRRRRHRRRPRRPVLRVVLGLWVFRPHVLHLAAVPAAVHEPDHAAQLVLPPPRHGARRPLQQPQRPARRLRLAHDAHSRLPAGPAHQLLHPDDHRREMADPAAQHQRAPGAVRARGCRRHRPRPRAHHLSDRPEADQGRRDGHRAHPVAPVLHVRLPAVRAHERASGEGAQDGRRRAALAVDVVGAAGCVWLARVHVAADRRRGRHQRLRRRRHEQLERRQPRVADCERERHGRRRRGRRQAAQLQGQGARACHLLARLDVHLPVHLHRAPLLGRHDPGLRRGGLAGGLLGQAGVWLPLRRATGALVHRRHRAGQGAALRRALLRRRARHRPALAPPGGRQLHRAHPDARDAAGGTVVDAVSG